MGDIKFLEQEILNFRKRLRIERTVFVLIILVILCSGVFLKRTDFSHPTPATTAVLQDTTQDQMRYDNLLNAWNQSARDFKLDQSYLLSSGNRDQLVSQMSRYLEWYGQPLTQPLRAEFDAIIARYPRSLWALYYEFLQTHQAEYSVNGLQPATDEDELLQKLKGLTGAETIGEAIKLALASLDPCSYFAIYKYELWDTEQLSKNIETCNNSMVDANRYPELSKLIRSSIE